MTAVDRAFIKAYTSRRSPRGAAADMASESRVLLHGTPGAGPGALSYRVDRPHAAVASPVAVASPLAAPQAKSTARKSRPDSTELGTPAPAPAPAAAPIDRSGRSGRVAGSPADPATTPDWIWQRQPHPVFADKASTAGAALDVTVAKSPPKNPQPLTHQAPKSPASKVLSPDILSLTAASVGVAPPTGPAATALARSAPLPMGSSQSGPLSSFTVTPRIEDQLQPALEVDRFLWPAEIAKLSDRAATALDAFATQLMDGARRGQRRVGLIGAAPAAGTTTVALCVAHLARVKKATWGLLDADFEHAALASRLGIAQTAGWQAVLSGRERLADVSIASLDDRLVFVPLSNEGLELEELAANYRAPVLFSMLADIVDLMLVDAGFVAPQAITAGMITAGSVTAGTVTSATVAAETNEQKQINRLVALVRAARLDAVYLVYDERSTTPDELAASADRLEGVGISIAGTIVNFAAD